MEHNTCRENLSAYLDGELPREEKLSLEGHLADCRECSRELAELKQVSAIFKRHAMQPVPDSLKEAVFAGKREKQFFSHWLRPVSALAAVAAGLLIMLTLPKVREREQVAEPEFYSGAYRYGGATQGALSGSSALTPEGGSALSAASSDGTAGGNMNKAAPSLKSGAFGQAKFAGSGLEGGRGASASAESFSGKAAGSTAGWAISGAGLGGGAVLSRGAGLAETPPSPAAIADIVADGVLFRAARWREGFGNPRNGGSVRAFDARSGELLWEARVYEAAEDPNLEAGAQQVHISALALNGKKLVITDEKGNRYQLDIQTRKIEKLAR